MHIEGALAAPLAITYSRRAAGTAAVREPGLSPVDGPERPGPAAATGGSTSRQRTLGHDARQLGEERRLLSGQLTAEDFAAIQSSLGLRRVSEAGLSLVDDEAELTIQEIPPPPPQRPDFSEAVADAVVTIEEYLAWVSEAGGRPT